MRMNRILSTKVVMSLTQKSKLMKKDEHSDLDVDSESFEDQDNDDEHFMNV